jgi:ankyrin repeat protein
LHFAARYGQQETGRLLLDAGADVNAIGNWKQTALTEAVQARDLASVQLLLSRGAAVNHVDEQNHTPLWYATRSPEKAQVRILISQGGRY